MPAFSSLSFSGLSFSTGGAPVVVATPILTAARTPLGPLLDQYLDPITLDYVRTDDGSWLQTPDSRTMVMIQIELKLGESYSTPNDGTRIKAILEADDGAPLTTDTILTETLRSLAVLEDAGMIADVVATMTDAHGELLVDESGRPLVNLNWRDLASGSPVDLAYSPFQG